MQEEHTSEHNEQEKRRYIEKLLSLIPENGDLVERLSILPILYADYRWKWDDKSKLQELSYDSFYSTLSTWAGEEAASYLLDRAAHLPKMAAFGKLVSGLLKHKNFYEIDDHDRYDKLRSRVDKIHDGTLGGLAKICAMARYPTRTMKFVLRHSDRMTMKHGKSGDTAGPFTLYRTTATNDREEKVPVIDIFLFEHNNDWRKGIQDKNPADALHLMRTALSLLAEKLEEPGWRDVQRARGRSWLMAKLGLGLGFTVSVSRRPEFEPGKKLDFSQRQIGYSDQEDFWGQFVNFDGTLRKDDIVEFFMTNRAYPAAVGGISRDDLLQKYGKKQFANK